MKPRAMIRTKRARRYVMLALLAGFPIGTWVGIAWDAGSWLGVAILGGIMAVVCALWFGIVLLQRWADAGADA